MFLFRFRALLVSERANMFSLAFGKLWMIYWIYYESFENVHHIPRAILGLSRLARP